jgi:hypothetical protein
VQKLRQSLQYSSKKSEVVRDLFLEAIRVRFIAASAYPLLPLLVR